MAGFRGWVQRAITKWREGRRTESSAGYASEVKAAAMPNGGQYIVDSYSPWVAKNAEESVREIIGHTGINPQRDFPGIQVRKGQEIGEVQWGRECRTAQDAQIESRMMRDRYLEFRPPDIHMREPSEADVRKAEKVSQQIGAPVRTKAWRKYAREYAREHLEGSKPRMRR